MSETERMVELETRLAFQEHTLSELNGIVADQARELIALRRQLAQLLDDLRTMRGLIGADPASEPTPPHY